MQLVILLNITNVLREKEIYSSGLNLREKRGNCDGGGGSLQRFSQLPGMVTPLLAGLANLAPSFLPFHLVSYPSSPFLLDLPISISPCLALTSRTETDAPGISHQPQQAAWLLPPPL